MTVISTNGVGKTKFNMYDLLPSTKSIPNELKIPVKDQKL
jgi:hypothetical protein